MDANSNVSLEEKRLNKRELLDIPEDSLMEAIGITRVVGNAQVNQLFYIMARLIMRTGGEPAQSAWGRRTNLAPAAASRDSLECCK
jgi:hypothetical protein